MEEEDEEYTYAEIQERIHMLEQQEAKSVDARDYEHAQDIVREIQLLRVRMAQMDPGVEEREVDPLQKPMDLHRVDKELDDGGYTGADFDIEDDEEEGELEFEEDGEEEDYEHRGGLGPSAMGMGMGMGAKPKKGGRGPVKAGPSGFMSSPTKGRQERFDETSTASDDDSPDRKMRHDDDSEADEDEDEQVNVSSGSSHHFEGKENEDDAEGKQDAEEEEEELREIDLSDKRHFLTHPVPKACGTVKGYVLRYYSNSFNKLHPEYTLHLEVRCWPCNQSYGSGSA